MKKCSECKIEREEEEFSFKNKKSGRRQTICKVCTRKRIREHYYKNKDYYLYKTKIRNSKLRETLRKYVWDYLTKHPCLDCGEDDPVVLEFDHTRDKISSISKLIKNGISLSSIIKEIDKCEVRCANCHRRKTAKDFDWNKVKFASVAQLD